jgi:hypothetical protein
MPGSTVTVEELAVVDDERRADGLPALRTSATARQQRHAELATEVDRDAHVLVRARDQHADRFDLVDRRVGRIAAARGAVEEHFALYGPAQP